MEDIFSSPGLLPAEQNVRSAQEAGESLPGSPDLRDLTHPNMGDWRKFRATLQPKYGRAWLEIFFSVAMLLGGYAAHFVLARRLGNFAGLIGRTSLCGVAGLLAQRARLGRTTGRAEPE